METFEILAQKSKKRNLKKMIGIAVGVVFFTLTCLYAGHLWLSHKTHENITKLHNHYQLRQQIAYPNIEFYQWETQLTGNYTGKIHIERFKDIDGVKLPYEDVNADVSSHIAMADRNADRVDFIGGKQLNNSSFYTKNLGYKIPVFYNIQDDGVVKDREASKPTHELKFVKEMTNQLVEVALTFDKPYSYEELENMLPNNLKKNWYWIGTKSTFNTAELPVSDIFGLRIDDKNPQESYKLFYSNLREQRKTDFGYSSWSTDSEVYKTEDDWAYFYKNYTSLSKAKFSGIILTGKAENFAQLEKKEWIYASSIGASTQNQPYYQLDRE